VFLEFDGLQHEEEVLAVPVHLWPLIGMNRILHGKFVELESVCHSCHLGVGRLVEADPGEPVRCAPHPEQGRDRIGAGGVTAAVEVGAAVDQGLVRRYDKTGRRLLADRHEARKRR